MCLNHFTMTTRDVKRSAVYHLCNTIAPINHKLKAELDVLGVVAIVALVLGIVGLVRLILALA
jgi:hypothetical protein